GWADGLEFVRVVQRVAAILCHRVLRLDVRGPGPNENDGGERRREQDCEKDEGERRPGDHPIRRRIQRREYERARLRRDQDEQEWEKDGGEKHYHTGVLSFSRRSKGCHYLPWTGLVRDSSMRYPGLGQRSKASASSGRWWFSCEMQAHLPPLAGRPNIAPIAD